jgi:uncharacterized membrane protein YkvA (DUF1232 family)
LTGKGNLLATILDASKRRARQLKIEIDAIYLAYKDPRVPWYAKLLIACVIGYALSPIDLIPDFIPVIGYLDDLILVPLGIALALKMIPPAVLADCREKARTDMTRRKRTNWIAAALILCIWVLLALFVIFLIVKIAQ